jgi:hypothetical protein
MELAYKYKVLSVDTSSNCMEVEFTSDGLPEVTVGVRVPHEGEDVDAVIRSFAPIAFWQPVVVALQDVAVGYEGEVQPVPIDPAAVENSEMWARVAFEKNVAEVLVKFGVLESDPTVVPVTNL